MSKQIGIIGSGIVGQTLANGFIRHGFEVMIGTNNAEKIEELKAKTGGKAKIGSFEETAKFGSIIVLAVKGTIADAALKLAGIANLKGKTIIDTTNPIADAPPVKGVLQYFTPMNESLLERLQQLAPEANFVKSFSCVGTSAMINPTFGGDKPTMFICGNNSNAKTEVKAILDLFGWETDDMGDMEAARAIEPLAILWCIPGFLRNDWTRAFKMLRK